MKARVKGTDVELEVHLVDKQARYIGSDDIIYWEEDLDFNVEGKFAENCLNGIKQNIVYDSDYWTKLEHQYAGIVMQGVLTNNDLLKSLCKKAKGDTPIKFVAIEFASSCAHALVEKMKEKK